MALKSNSTTAVREACRTHGGFYLRSIGGAAANLAEHCIGGGGFCGLHHHDDKGNDFCKELNPG